jgi:predicted O-methyltransferase YrrM
VEKLKELNRERFERFRKQKEEIRRLWNIDQKTAELMYVVVKAKNPANILEIGTSNGYSSFIMSLAVDTERCLIETIEVDESRYSMAQENLQGIGHIKQYLSKAEDLIPKLTNSYDVVFLDANKPAYINYFHLIREKLKPGAIVIADNICSHPETTMPYRSFMLNNPEFFSTLIEIDAGILISVLL